MAKFRKKPVVIDAIQFTDKSKERALMFVGRAGYANQDNDGTPVICIDTLEGIMRATFGDWIIKGIHGEFYPCKPDVFKATYEPADDEAVEFLAHMERKREFNEEAARTGSPARMKGFQ